MCKWLRDILFPTNILGSDTNVVKYDFSDTTPPVVPITPPWDKRYQFTIIWSGDVLNLCYTKVNRTGIGSNMKIWHDQIRETYYKGDNTTEVQLTPDGTIHLGNGSWVQDEILYLKCTNVTKLIVNGEQLI